MTTACGLDCAGGLIVLFQRRNHAVKTRLPKPVVLIEDGNVFHPESNQLIDDGFGFIRVTGANVEHVTIVRLVFGGLAKRIGA